MTCLHAKHHFGAEFLCICQLFLKIKFTAIINYYTFQTQLCCCIGDYLGQLDLFPWQKENYTSATVTHHSKSFHEQKGHLLIRAAISK